MRFQIVTPLIAGCVAQVAADATPASVVDTVVASSPNEHEVVSSPTNDVGEKRQHRLLQRMKKRYNANNSENQSGGNPDIGILASKSNNPRFLQDDYDYYCPTDTCPTELCDCAEKGGSLEDCTVELQNVCRAGRLEDCVFSDYVKVYEDVYCPFVACTVEGFREAQCDCAFYDLYCTRLVSDDCNTVLQMSTDDPDKKPFFGCDETELQNVCAEAHSCKDRGDLQGLPDLGTWKGSVTTGIKSNSGQSIGGGSVVVGVTFMSMLWLMVNV